VISVDIEIDLDNSRRSRVAPEVLVLLAFFNTGAGSPRDIINKMRFVIETYCTLTFLGFFDFHDTLWSIVEKIRNTGEQHPACALLDELDDIHDYSRDCDRGGDPATDAFEHLDLDELMGFVRRTLKIVNAIL
jgi:hypothetical protein